ncbi:hypothetical protein GA0070216_1417 [Micromonospora matsumotoense]|uniref:Uncharacterized protein n=1 Tax=Micromonospora matsumotoense TaxID=121616 RepID=A0A1C5AXI9_9ACTN|nr:hypothetical protein GA0070216_1417 [Micromonospora matsumotoense]
MLDVNHLPRDASVGNLTQVDPLCRWHNVVKLSLRAPIARFPRGRRSGRALSLRHTRETPSVLPVPPGRRALRETRPGRSDPPHRRSAGCPRCVPANRCASRRLARVRCPRPPWWRCSGPCPVPCAARVLSPAPAIHCGDPDWRSWNLPTPSPTAMRWSSWWSGRAVRRDSPPVPRKAPRPRTRARCGPGADPVRHGALGGPIGTGGPARTSPDRPGQDGSGRAGRVGRVGATRGGGTGADQIQRPSSHIRADQSSYGRRVPTKMG